MFKVILTKLFSNKNRAGSDCTNWNLGSCIFPPTAAIITIPSSIKIVENMTPSIVLGVSDAVNYCRKLLTAETIGIWFKFETRD